MWKLAQMILVGFMAVSLIACGKTDDQKAQDNAQDMVTEHNNLLQDLISSGTPSASWSDADLNAFEAKVNRLESLESQLAGVNGSHGITVTGGDGSAVISMWRQEIASARAEKARAGKTSNAS